jgi:hypothetical protein
MKTILKTVAFVFLLHSCFGLSLVMGQEKLITKFEAEGPTQPVKFDRSQFRGAVKVTFDLIPTTMSFDLPWTYAMVNQQGVKFSTLAAETYDPRDFDGTGEAWHHSNPAWIDRGAMFVHG